MWSLWDSRAGLWELPRVGALLSLIQVRPESEWDVALPPCWPWLCGALGHVPGSVPGPSSGQSGCLEHSVLGESYFMAHGIGTCRTADNRPLRASPFLGAFSFSFPVMQTKLLKQGGLASLLLTPPCARDL